MARQHEKRKAIGEEARGHEREENGAGVGSLDRAERRPHAAESPRVPLEPRAADGGARDREDEAVREHAAPGERGCPSLALASHDRRGEIRGEPVQERPRHLDAAHDDGDRASKLEGAASPRVGDEAGSQLAQSRGVSARAELEEEAHGGDREKEVSEGTRDVPDLGETPARAYALGGAKEHEGEEACRHDREDEAPVPSREGPGERVHGPGGAPALEERHPSRDPPHEHVDEPAREEAEPRERVRDPLLRSPSRRRHARHLRRRRGAAGERGRTGS